MSNHDKPNDIGYWQEEDPYCPGLSLPSISLEF